MEDVEEILDVVLNFCHNSVFSVVMGNKDKKSLKLYVQ